MAIPLAALALPALGAGLGALEGYKKGGGTGAVLGAGAGALTPAALRMAGAGLAGIPALAGLVQKGAMGARAAAGLQGPVMSGANILKTGVPAVGLALNAPGIAGGIAGGASGAANTAGQLGVGAVGGALNNPGAANYGGTGLPPGLGQYGPTSPYGSLTDVYGVPGMAQRQDLRMTAKAQRDVLRTLLPEVERAIDARSQKELNRQLAAAGARQNIETRALMQQRAQLAGLNAGQSALEAAGTGLMQQYQYQ